MTMSIVKESDKKYQWSSYVESCVHFSYRNQNVIVAHSQKTYLIVLSQC